MVCFYLFAFKELSLVWWFGSANVGFAAVFVILIVCVSIRGFSQTAHAVVANSGLGLEAEGVIMDLD